MREYTDVFLARQPILDRRGQVIAFELLFRDDAGEARFSDTALATAKVIAGAFKQLGLQSVVGGCAGFVNVDAEMLHSRKIERLPKERVVLELLENVVIDDDIVHRCAELKHQGYRLALDDFCAFDARYEPLLEIVDIVKIDILELDHCALAQLVDRLKLYPARLLAEKVETLDKARHCRALGFDLFQGFFYCRPSLVAR